MIRIFPFFPETPKARADFALVAGVIGVVLYITISVMIRSYL